MAVAFFRGGNFLILAVSWEGMVGFSSGAFARKEFFQNEKKAVDKKADIM